MDSQNRPGDAAARSSLLHHVASGARLDTLSAWRHNYCPRQGPNRPREKVGSPDYALPPAGTHTGDTLAELARFFAVATDSTQMCPMFSAYIDQAWHTLLATPDRYAKFSWAACGQVLGHQASLGDDRIPWISDYEARFGRLPPLWFADAAGAVDQTVYTTYRATGEVFHSWDCNPITDDDEE